MGGRRLVWQRLAGVGYALSVMSLFKTRTNKVLRWSKERMVIVGGEGFWFLMYSVIHVGKKRMNFGPAEALGLGRERGKEGKGKGK